MTGTQLRSAIVGAVLCLVMAACGSTAQLTVDGMPVTGGPMDGPASVALDDSGLELPGPTDPAALPVTGGAAPEGAAAPAGDEPQPAAGGTAPAGTAAGTPAGSSAPGGSRGAPAAGRGGTGGGGPAKGEPIKVGYLADAGNPVALFGIDNPVPSEDDIRRWYKAVADYLNERGGVHGRPLEPVVRFVDQTDQSEGNQTRLQTEMCVQMTEDLKVLFVMGERTSFAQKCYVQHETAFFNAVNPADAKEFSDHQPWMIPSYFPVFDRMARLIPVSLAQQGKAAEKVGIIAFDRPEYHRVVDGILIPELQRHGAEVEGAVYAAVAYDDIAAQMANAVLQFSAAGVERVVVFGQGGGLWLVFATQAESQGYRPAYGISSMDRAFFITDAMPPEQKRDIAGPGIMMQLDIDAVAQPDPTKAMRDCWKIVNEGAGENVQHGSIDAIAVLAVCESVFLTDYTLEHSPDASIERADVPGLFRAAGTGFRSLLMSGLDFTAPRMDATRDYANMIYDRDCECMRYITGWQRIPF